MFIFHEINYDKPRLTIMRNGGSGEVNESRKKLIVEVNETYIFRPNLVYILEINL